MDIEGSQKYRASKIAEYAGSVTNDNANEWMGIIELCTTVKSNDLATFPSFGEFLKRLAAHRPEIVVEYLRNLEDALGNFIQVILAGLAEGNRPELALSFVSEWVDQGRHLHAIARYLEFTSSTPEELVVRVGEQAIKRKDRDAVIGVCAAIVARRLRTLVDSIFLPSVQMLTSLKDARLVNGVWFLPSLKAFVEGLTEEQSEVLLLNLVLREAVDYHDERVLVGIAGRHPALVLNFFKARLDHEKARVAETRYEAVPYHMTDLGKILAQDPKQVLLTARSWYSSNDKMFSYTGGRLLQNIFPELTDGYEAELHSLVRSGLDDDVNLVLSLLRAYRGGIFLHETCKALIDVLPDSDAKISQIRIILDSTGAVWGEFGMVEVYQRKKAEMQPWLGDSRSKVRAFAETHIRALDRQIAAEQRRSETEHELRRREWPDEETLTEDSAVSPLRVGSAGS